MEEAAYDFFEKLNKRLKRNPLVLPFDPSDDELAKDWSVSEPDKAEIKKCRGDFNKLWFALLLCALRKFGRFFDPQIHVPPKIVNHLAYQLRLPAVLYIPAIEREATLSSYYDRIARYLGFSFFNDAERERLQGWIRDSAEKGYLPEELFEAAEHALKTWKVIPPSYPVLQAMIRSTFSQFQNAIYGRIANCVSGPAKEAIDAILDVTSGSRTSTLFQLSEYPPGARDEEIVDYVNKYQKVSSIISLGVDLSGVSGKLVQHYFEAAKSYNVYDLRRFEDDNKRYALVACYLIELQKKLLDYIVGMNAQHLTDMNRRVEFKYNQKVLKTEREARKGLSVIFETACMVVDETIPDPNLRPQIYGRFGKEAIEEWIKSNKRLHHLESHGRLQEYRHRFENYRNYLPQFLTLPFSASIGSQDLLDAIALANARFSRTSRPDFSSKV